MKDVGLLDFGNDDFGFGLDPGSSQHNLDTDSAQNLNTSLNSSQNSSSSDLEAADPAPAPAPAPAPGLRVTHGYPPQASVAAQPQALQLVQGPDGNFVLQTNPAVLQTNPAAPPPAEPASEARP